MAGNGLGSVNVWYPLHRSLTQGRISEVTRVTSHLPGAAAYFVLLSCPRPNSQTLKFYSPVTPDPLNARSLRSLGFPKSPPLKKS